MSLVAGVAAAVAVWLCVGGSAAPVRLPPVWVLVIPAGVACFLLGLSPRVLVLLCVAVGAGWFGRCLLARRHVARIAVETSGRVLESCELMAAELAAGSPSGVALARAADRWSPLTPAARAAQLGGDVPAALREVSTQPGAGDLRLVAGAWTVAHRTGHGLSDALSAVAESVRGSTATRRVVAGELASARATARLVAALPVVAWLMGAGSGAQPWEFLIGGPLGLACLVGGLGCMAAGLWWIEALASGDGP